MTATLAFCPMTPISEPMSALTRRRSPDAQQEIWLPKFTEADFNEYRRQRAMDAWKRATWEAGLKLPTQITDGRSRCFYGAEIQDRGRGACAGGAHGVGQPSDIVAQVAPLCREHCTPRRSVSLSKVTWSVRLLFPISAVPVSSARSSS